MHDLGSNARAVLALRCRRQIEWKLDVFSAPSPTSCFIDQPPLRDGEEPGKRLLLSKHRRVRQ